MFIVDYLSFFFFFRSIDNKTNKSTIFFVNNSYLFFLFRCLDNYHSFPRVLISYFSNLHMGGRLTTPPSSASSSSATAHRTIASNTATNLTHTRTHSNNTNHRHRSHSGHQNSHELFGTNSTNNHRHRTTSTNLDPIGTTAFNLNLLRYVGLEHDSDDQSTDDESPQARRRLQHFIITLRDVPCPVCNKTIPSDSFEKHIIQCLSKPRIDYNGLVDFSSFYLKNFFHSL